MNKMVSISVVAFGLSMSQVSANTLIFGDSLSDGGAAEAVTLATGGTWPYGIYPQGQFTNGDSWATKIGSDFASGYNFAFGGARARDNGDNIPDFLAQVGNYLTSGLDASMVDDVAIWFGGNDFRDLLLQPVPPSQTDIELASGAIIQEIFTGIGAIATTGLTKYSVFGLPDLSQIPQVVNTPSAPTVSAIISGYNDALATSVAGFAAQTGLDVSYFDVQSIVEDVFADAGALGITELEESCLSNPVDCKANPNSFFFYDDLHPTDVVHAELAKTYTSTVVPLPAGMPLVLSGLILLVLASRGNRSRA